MTAVAISSAFAPAEKAPIDVLKEQAHRLAANPVVFKILDAVPEAMMILNGQRQILYANQATLELLSIKDRSAVFGLRPGDILNCPHAEETEGGCGTTRFCRYCGAVKAILSSQQGKITIEECRLTNRDSGVALDIRVKASPYWENQECCTVLSLTDISGEKRKQALESIFFHDILNMAGGLMGYAELMLTTEAKDNDSFKVIIHRLAQDIIDEISAQRQLLEAENGTLQPDAVTLNSLDILKATIEAYRYHEVAVGKDIHLESRTESVDFKSDRALLLRVLGNLLKNALEATPRGGIVRLKGYRQEDDIVFEIHNQQTMSESVQMQIFQRSFSTKERGRGLGTYSIKLLTERYLRGRVTFQTDAATGTTFWARYPLRAKAETTPPRT